MQHKINIFKKVMNLYVEIKHVENRLENEKIWKFIVILKILAVFKIESPKI